MVTTRRAIFDRGSTSIPGSFWLGSSSLLSLPEDAILTEDGQAILTETSEYILTEA